MNKAIPKQHDWFSLLMATLLMLSAFPALEGSPGRGVYVNGQVHRIWINSSGLQHVAGYPANPTGSPANWVFTRASDPQSSGWKVTNNMFSGMNLAVFDDKIFVPFTSFDSGFASGTMHSYVAAFDLPTNKWISKKQLGLAHSDNPSEGAGSGAATVVLNDMLYVFTDSGTYTSADGINWSSYGPLVSDSRYQPIEAVTYYLPDAAPRVLIIYGYITGEHNYWDQLYYATWNGTIGTGSDFPSKPILDWNAWVYGNVSVQLGTLDAVMNSPAGPKGITAQLFASCPTSSGPAMIRHAAFTLTSSGISGTQSHTFTDGGTDSLWTYTWYLDRCDTTTTPLHQARQQIIVTHYNNGSDKAIPGSSDFQVPVNTELTPNACGDWAGSITDTSDPADAATLRKYWSLYAVILGSPPFAHNYVQDYEVPDLSNVEYGQVNGTQIQHEQSWENKVTFSAGLELRYGMEKVTGIESKTDIGIMHSWDTEKESSNKVTKQFSIPLGTSGSNPENLGELGRFGWAIFGIPKTIVQDFALYAYDWDIKTGQGTALNQDVHLVDINPSSMTIQPYAFELENPGGPEDDVPGLLTGIRPFPKSTDLAGWQAQAWESTQEPWTVVLGDGSLRETAINTLRFTTGAPGGSVSVSQDTENVVSSGKTSQVEVSEQLTIGKSTKLKGWKVDLSAGYEGTFSMKVTNTTSFGQELKVDLSMKPCGEPEAGCVKSLTDQTYLLQATDSTAPWVPAAYSSQRPWALAYRVTDYVKNEGTAGGVTATPESASGLVVGGQGGTAVAGESSWSRYTMQGAPLVFKNSDQETLMTASEFKPAKGVTLDINGFKWSSLNASGTWTKLGNVWLYESRRSVKRNQVFLKLNFGKRTWDLELYKADLSGRLAAGAGDIHVTLVLNGKYTFRTGMRHHLEMAWNWQGQPDYSGDMAILSYQGEYDSSQQKGSIALEGTLPDKLETFGDMTFEVNGHPIHVPFLNHPNFASAWENAGSLEYLKEGVRVGVSFSKKTWTATFEKQSFDRKHVPVRGKSRIRVLVGGTAWKSLDIPVEDFTTRLKLDS